MTAKQALILAKNYTKETIEGEGAIKGKDGFSPTVETKEVEGGTEVSITDATHTETFVVQNGTGSGTFDYTMIQGSL